MADLRFMSDVGCRIFWSYLRYGISPCHPPQGRGRLWSVFEKVEAEAEVKAEEEVEVEVEG